MTDYSKRTPGPWALLDETTVVVDPEHKRLHICSTDENWLPHKEKDANAAFIVACENAMTAAGIVNPAAVPEIVSTLRAARHFLDYLIEEGICRDEFYKDTDPGTALYRSIDAALAKAREAKA